MTTKKLEMWIDCGKNGGFVFCTNDGEIQKTGMLKFSSNNTVLSFASHWPSKMGKNIPETIGFCDEIHIELLKPFGRDTATTAFTMGMCYATLRCTIKAMTSAPIILHEPKEWKAEMRKLACGRLAQHQKEEALLFVEKVLGKEKLDKLSLLTKKHHDGIVDAIAMMLAMKGIK
jgi:hypothetical protein